MASNKVQKAPLDDPDVRLMIRVQSGDERAFAELVENYQDRIVGIFSHVLGDHEAAEDLAQETFLRVYRARNSYEPTAKFATWLFRIANNLASNSRRSRARRREIGLANSESGTFGSRPIAALIPEKSGLMPTRQADQHELQQIVQDALATLDDRQRFAVLLNKFEQMSYSEIAEALESTPDAVKALLARARDNLRSRLDTFSKSKH